MERENFGSRFGALMALTGSSIGLGNLWRFPYMVGTYGGAAFILVYIILVFVICLPIINAEILVGRRSQANAFGAFKKLAPGTPWKWAGLLMVITPMLVLCYYSVIGGWSVEYLVKSLTFSFTGSSATHEQLGGMFDAFVSSTWLPLICHTVFLVITALIIAAGVQKGIERFGKVMTPLLFVIILLIAVRAATLPGAGEGYKYLFQPDFSKITPQVCIAALGQGFFSLSVGFGIMLTYGSYVNKKENICNTATYTTIADTVFALIASCAIMPAVFVFGLSPQAGPGLLFKTLPFVFSQMPLGGVIAILFFLALLVAALTSSISIYEVGTTYLVEEKHISRKKADIIIFVFAWIVGALCSLSFGPLSGAKIFGMILFDFFDYLSANILITVGALLTVLFVGWQMKRADVYSEFTNEGLLKANARIFPPMYFIIKYICPLAIVVILVSGLL